MFEQTPVEGTPPLIPNRKNLLGTPSLHGFPQYQKLADYLLCLSSDIDLRLREVSLLKLLSLRAITHEPRHEAYVSIWGLARAKSPVRTMLQRTSKQPRQNWQNLSPKSKCILFCAKCDSENLALEIEKVIRHERLTANKLILAVKFASKHQMWYRLSAQLYEPSSPFYSKVCTRGLKSSTSFERELEQLNDKASAIFANYQKPSSRVSRVPLQAGGN